MDKFLELCEKEKKNPGVIQESIALDTTNFPFYENAKELYDSWLLPSFGTWGRKLPHRERYQKLAKEGKLESINSFMNPLLQEWQTLQGI